MSQFAGFPKHLNTNATILKSCNVCGILVGIREIVLSGAKILCEVVLYAKCEI